MRPPESFLGQPIRNLQTMLRVIFQNNNNVRPIVPDGIYGAETKSAVTYFQKTNGIPATGITDERTWNAIERAYLPARTDCCKAQPLQIDLNSGQIIKKGEADLSVYLVQGMLAGMNQIYQNILMPGFSGVLDKATQDSILSFQSLNGIPETGELDKTTWRYLVLQYPLAMVKTRLIE